jgi:LysR family transcriptional regulator, glycine cleavage system transcriptional activator
MTHSYANLPPFDALIAMLVAAECGSFSATAEELGITHSSVSRRIGHVERWLGTPVFERHARGVTLSPAGQRFIVTVRHALTTIEDGADEWKPRTGRATVRISVVPSFARIWLISQLATLSGGDLQIQVLPEHRPLDLDAREADLAVRYGIGPYPDLKTQTLIKEEVVPCATPQIAKELGDSPSAAQVHQYPLIHDASYHHWRRWFEQSGMVYRPRERDRRFEDYDMVLLAAAEGLGLAMLRLPTAAHWAKKHGLVRLPVTPMVNKSAYHLVMRANEARPEVLLAGRRLSELCAKMPGLES